MTEEKIFPVRVSKIQIPKETQLGYEGGHLYGEYDIDRIDLSTEELIFEGTLSLGEGEFEKSEARIDPNDDFLSNSGIVLTMEDGESITL